MTKRNNKEMKTIKIFNLKVFCGNCYMKSILTFNYGTEIEERGYGSDKLLHLTLPNGEWQIAKCPQCGSMNLNKRF